MKLLETLENHILFDQGDPSDVFYIILEGNVEMVAKEVDGSEKIVNEYGQGRSFGERGLIQKAPRSLMVRTKTF
jgi:CRP-like cAMP-binding protein